MTVISNFPVIEVFPESICPECEGAVISDSFRGETICNTCGLVVKEKEIDLSIEKNIYNEREKELRARTGEPNSIFIADISYTTKISRSDIKNDNFFRLAKLNKGSNSKRRIILAQKELFRISANLNLSSNIKAIAMFLYKKAQKEGIVRGSSIEGMVAACLYYACRKLKAPISIREIVKESLYNLKYIEQKYLKLLTTFNLKVPVINPTNFVSRYIAELELDIEIEQKVRNILNSIRSTLYNGINPIVLCASVIFLVCKKENRKITQIKISKTTGITELSIRNNIEKLKPYLLK